LNFKDFLLKALKNIPWILVTAYISGVLFILLFSTWNTPLFGGYGFDSAFFSMAGRAITRGYVPYRDFFDVKGPVFFFWEAFGQLILKGNNGIIFLEIVAITGCMTAVYMICNLYGLSYRKIIFVYIWFYSTYFICLWGGNCLEEYILPLNLFSIYFGLKVCRSNSLTVKSFIPAFYIGAVAGICLFSKAVVFFPSAAVLIVVALHLLSNKNFKGLGICAGLFTVGFLAVSIPVIIYFLAHNALYDMINAAFITAFKRGVDYYEPVSLNWESYIIPSYTGILFSFVLLLRKRTQKGIFLIILSVFTAVGLHFGTPFDYYFINQIPVMVIMAVFICDEIPGIYKESTAEIRKGINIILIGVLCLIPITLRFGTRTIEKITDTYKMTAGTMVTEDYRTSAMEIYNMIPITERQYIYSLESGMIFFEITGALPSNKYCVNMPYFCDLYNKAEEEILDYLENNSPRYIVTEELANLDNDVIRDYVYDHYYKIKETEYNSLWELK